MEGYYAPSNLAEDDGSGQRPGEGTDGGVPFFERPRSVRERGPGTFGGTYECRAQTREDDKLALMGRMRFRRSAGTEVRGVFAVAMLRLLRSSTCVETPAV